MDAAVREDAFGRPMEITAMPPPAADAAPGEALVPVEGDPFMSPPTSEELHAQLAAEAEVGLELAALARLKAWETCTEGYTLEEIMDLVRWMERSLAVRKREPWWSGIARLTRKSRLYLGLVAAAVFLLLLVGMGVVSGLAMSMTRTVEPDSNGVLLADDAALGTATAVHLRSISDYGSLPVSQLRLVQDVVFRHRGAFHFHRVAAVSYMPNGGILIQAEDGGQLKIVDDVIMWKPVWGTEEQVDPLETQNFGLDRSQFASAGSFAAVTTQ